MKYKTIKFSSDIWGYWLTPLCEWVPVAYKIGETHVEVAITILHLDISPSPEEVYRKMFYNKYLRIIVEKFYPEYIDFTKNPQLPHKKILFEGSPSRKQIAELKNIAIEHNLYLDNLMEQY